MGKSRTFELFKKSKEGREEVQDQRGHFPHSTVGTTEKIKEIEDMVTTDRRRSIHDMASKSGVSYDSVHTILNDDLGLSKLCPHWVPHLLTDTHKQQHMEMATDFKRFNLPGWKYCLPDLNLIENLKDWLLRKFMNKASNFTMFNSCNIPFLKPGVQSLTNFSKNSWILCITKLLLS